MSLVLKVVSSGCDAFLEPGFEAIHCCAPLVLGDLSDVEVNCILEQLHIGEHFTTHLGLQQGEEPIVWRVEIWTVGWVGQCDHSVLLNEVADDKAAVRRSAVMQQSPTISAPNLWSPAPNGLPKIRHHLEICGTINAMALGHKGAVHQAKLVKETNQHDLGNTLLTHHNARTALVLCQPLSVVSPGLWIIGVKPGFIAADDMIHSPPLPRRRKETRHLSILVCICMLVRLCGIQWAVFFCTTKSFLRHLNVDPMLNPD